MSEILLLLLLVVSFIGAVLVDWDGYPKHDALQERDDD
jgi:hypothetical protein